MALAAAVFVLVCGGGDSGGGGGGGDVLPGDRKQEVTLLRRLPTPRCPGAGLLAQVFVFGVDRVLQSGPVMWLEGRLCLCCSLCV